MNQLTLPQVIHQLGPANVTGFFLVLARVSPLFVLAPLFSSRMLPPRVRGIIAVALAIGLTGVAMHGQHIPTSPFAVAGLIVEQVLVGIAFAFSVAVLFAAVQAAGALTDSLAGFSFGAQVDPINGNQGGAFSSLYTLVGLALFIAIDGDAWILRGLGRTFDLVPLSHGPRLGSLVGGAELVSGTLFTSALEVAAPAVMALMLTDVAFGLVSRAVPQVSVFSVGFPLKVGVALLVVAASLPFLAGWMSDQLVPDLGYALHSLHV